MTLRIMTSIINGIKQRMAISIMTLSITILQKKTLKLSIGFIK